MASRGNCRDAVLLKLNLEDVLVLGCCCVSEKDVKVFMCRSFTWTIVDDNKSCKIRRSC